MKLTNQLLVAKWTDKCMYLSMYLYIYVCIHVSIYDYLCTYINYMNDSGPSGDVIQCSTQTFIMVLSISTGFIDFRSRVSLEQELRSRLGHI